MIDYYLKFKENNEDELYKLAKYAEELYSKKLFQSVPNAVRFFFERLLCKICDELNIDNIYMSDKANHFNIDNTVSSVLSIGKFKDYRITKKILREIQSIVNTGSHIGFEKLDNYILQDNANLALKNMALLYQWFCNEFLDINLPFNYTLPKFINSEDIERRYNDLTSQYDELEQDIKEKNKIINELNTQLNNLNTTPNELDKNEENTKLKNDLISKINQIKEEKDTIIIELKTNNQKLINENNILEQRIKEIKTSNTSTIQPHNMTSFMNNLNTKQTFEIEKAKIIENYNLEIEKICDEKNKISKKLETTKDTITGIKQTNNKLRNELEKIKKSNENLQIQNKYLLDLQNKYAEKLNINNNPTILNSNIKNTKQNNKQQIIEQKARNEAQNDKTVNIELYDAILKTIKIMYETNHSIYITRNTIKYFMKGIEALIILTYDLKKHKDFGFWDKKGLDIQEMEDVLYYLEDGGIISSHSGYYKPLTIGDND